MSRKFQTAIVYLLIAAFLLFLPTYASQYRGATGKLLVATPGVSPPFNQSVVFIARQSLFGAWGVIVNRPFIWKSDKKQAPAYFGGPVDCPQHVIGRTDDGSFQIAIKGDAAAARSLRNKRLVTGCAGWGLFQLDLEMLGGGWDVIDYDPALVFDTPADGVWDAAHDRALEDRVTKQKNFSDTNAEKK